MTEPILDKEWGADEELLLLDAIEMFGLGNWRAVGEYVGKSPLKCEAHYHGVYLNSKTAPLPDIEGPILNAELYGKDPTNYGKYDGMNHNSKSSKSKCSGYAELAGYSQKRSEFSVEWNNEVEKLLADMEFSPEDTELVRNVKLKMVESYNRILDGRHERKAFIFERGLVNEVSFNSLFLTEDQRPELLSFVRFYKTIEDFQIFISRLNREIHLRQVLERLVDYRRRGIRYEIEERHFLEALKNKSLPEPMQSECCQIHGPNFLPLMEYYPPRFNNFDVSYLESSELLTRAEMDLCSELVLLPRMYLYMKMMIVQESYFKSMVTKDDALRLFPSEIDPKIVIKIYELALQSGWINSH